MLPRGVRRATAGVGACALLWIGVCVDRLRPGLVLSGRYRLDRHLASGGMGQVWEGFDEPLLRTVAVKVMHPPTHDEFVMAERFRDEARFAAQLMHPNIVTVHDFGDHDGLAYLVMELVDGPTLAALLARGPFEPDEVRRVVAQLAAALTVAHAAGIIHRDIKPANVLMAPDGQAKLMDFGIARSVDGSSLTSTGQVLGTAHYLSPEQAMGQSVGPATDLYALGILAHEMLTGARPFDRGTPIATALAHVQDEPPPLPDGTPAVLESVISACLDKDPAQRPEAALVAQLLADAEAGEAGRSADADEAATELPRRALIEP